MFHKHVKKFYEGYIKMNDPKVSIYDIQRIREKYPNRIPVLVIRASAVLSDIPNLPKNKFLVPSNLSLGGFIYIIRKQLSLSPDKAIFLFVNNTLPPSSITMAELYAQHKDASGVLRVTYTSESTFG